MTTTTPTKPYTITVLTRPGGTVLAEYRAATWAACVRRLRALRARAVFGPGGWVAAAAVRE